MCFFAFTTLYGGILHIAGVVLCRKIAEPWRTTRRWVLAANVNFIDITVDVKENCNEFIANAGMDITC